MMDKLTDKQRRELWEACGLKVETQQDRYASGWRSWGLWTKDGVRVDAPVSDLNNLFKWAVPKVWIRLNEASEAYKFDRLWEAIKRALLDGVDPALALSWVLFKLLIGEDNDISKRRQPLG